MLGWICSVFSYKVLYVFIVAIAIPCLFVIVLMLRDDPPSIKLVLMIWQACLIGSILFKKVEEGVHPIGFLYVSSVLAIPCVIYTLIYPPTRIAEFIASRERKHIQLYMIFLLWPFFTVNNLNLLVCCRLKIAELPPIETVLKEIREKYKIFESFLDWLEEWLRKILPRPRPHSVSFLYIVQALCIMCAVAFYTLLERKILAYIQTRKGPNKPGYVGILTPIADAIKLIMKEISSPSGYNKIFNLIPLISVLLPLMLWLAYPTVNSTLNLKFSALWFLCLSSVRVYLVLGAGWRRNRKYSILGAVRAVAQSISYEVRFSLIILLTIIFFLYNIINLKIEVLGVFLFFPIILFFVSLLAETNRRPFDFSEGESELVRGYNTEYSSTHFILLFLGEYISILFISTVVRILYNIRNMLDLYPFIVFWGCLFIWTRGTLPRLRYDQLIATAWKSLLPCSLGALALSTIA